MMCCARMLCTASGFRIVNAVMMGVIISAMYSATGVADGLNLYGEFKLDESLESIFLHWSVKPCYSCRIFLEFDHVRTVCRLHHSLTLHHLMLCRFGCYANISEIAPIMSLKHVARRQVRKSLCMLHFLCR